MRNVGLSFIAALALLSTFTVSAKETRLTDDAIAPAVKMNGRRYWPIIAPVCAMVLKTTDCKC